MTGEWTVELLKEYLERRLLDRDTVYTERHASNRRAADKAEASLERRFESVNEFRQALTDQTATFIRRDEYNAYHIALAEKVDLITSRLDKLEAALETASNSRVERRAGVSNAAAVGTVVTGLIMATIAIVALIIART